MVWVLSAALLALSGCSPLYVVRLGYEEMRILWRRQAIEEMLQEELPADTRAKLELTLAVRAFARDELHLDVRGSYASFARVDEKQVVHVVSAAPWNRLEAHTWWFPVVGRVPYRGYFRRRDAETLAAKMQQKGYDTYVRPSVAFSTLGWFDDPLLSNLLRYDVPALAEIIFHELLHNTIYVPGHTAFNESFATFVGSRGATLFFDRRGERERAQAARAHLNDTLAFSGFLAAVVGQLERAYREGIDRTQRQARFDAIQAEFRSLPWRTEAYRDFGHRPINNAVILHYWMYLRRLDLFEGVYEKTGQDLALTIARIRKACSGTRDPFAALEALIGPEDRRDG